MLATLVTLSCLALVPQDAAAPLGQRPAATAPGTTKAKADALQAQIRDMRMKLVLGGPRVLDAEKQAVQFFNDKIGVVDKRLDAIDGELAEKRTAYELALDRALNARDESARRAAMGDAQGVSGSVAELKDESDEFRRHRAYLNQQIDGVKKRDKERTKLAARLETTGPAGDPLMPLGPGLLAPEIEESGPAWSLDARLADDLLRRDPVRARRVLFEADPVGYWTRFPLRPPTSALLESLTFPSMDLPGRRY